MIPLSYLNPIDIEQLKQDVLDRIIQINDSKNGFLNYNSQFHLTGDLNEYGWRLGGGQSIIHNVAGATGGGVLTAVNGNTLKSKAVAINAVDNYQIVVNARIVIDPSKDVNRVSIYTGTASYDIDGREIRHAMVHYNNDTITELTQDLNDGDTEIYINNTDNWYNGSNKYDRSVIFWKEQPNGKFCYVSDTGMQYREYGYSRDSYTQVYNANGVDTGAKKIVLKSAWNKGYFPAGTKIANSADGGTYAYYHSNVNITSTDFTISISPTKTGQIDIPAPRSGVGGILLENAFRDGASSVRLIALPAYRWYDSNDNVTTDIGNSHIEYATIGLRSV